MITRDLPPAVTALLDTNQPPAAWRQDDRMHLEWLMYAAWRNAEAAYRHAEAQELDIWRDGEWQEAEAAAWRQTLSLRIVPDDEAVAHDLHFRWFRKRLEDVLTGEGITMEPDGTIHSDTCKHCGVAIQPTCNIQVGYCLVHSGVVGASFSGCFCSPSCLATFVSEAVRLLN